MFFFSFFFLIIQSQAAFVNCHYVARFIIVHSKTQIKFPLLLLLLLLYFALIRTFLYRSFDHDDHTFVVHYDTYNSDATLSLDAVLPLGKYIFRGHTFCTIK